MQHIGATLNATNDVINAKKNKNLSPCMSISFGECFSFSGNKKDEGWGHYATLPIAAAHALKTGLFKRILIIDEYVDENPDSVKELIKCDDPIKFIQENKKEYYKSGNGSLFYSKPHKKLFDLFNRRIITHDQIKNNLQTFINEDGKDIDLVFYNIDTERITYNEDRFIEISLLLHKLIPTIFILSNGFCKNTFEYIQKIAHDVSKKHSANDFVFNTHFQDGSIENIYTSTDLPMNKKQDINHR